MPGRLARNGRGLTSIFVENHSINSPIRTFSPVMNLDRDSHFDPAFYGILIQDFTAPSHIGHRLAEIVGLRPAAFFEDTSGGQASVSGPDALGVLGGFQ